MKRVTFKILFFIKRGRISKNGESPVFLRVTINGQRRDTSVSLKVNPDKWNALAEKSIGDTRIDNETNARIDTIRLRIMQIHRQMELDGVAINPQKIIDVYLGRNEKAEAKVTLLQLFREHNDKCHKLVGKDMSPATVERYETCFKHTAAFMKLNYKVDDILLEDINHKFITDYEFYLKTERNCSHNTATKYLKNFKKITRIALANELITRDPFANIKFTLQEVERDFLEDHEIHTILNKELTIERLEIVRDAFVFCIFTGLAFSDVKGLKKEHISRDNNGSLWIRKRRQKTKNMCNIPLLDVAKQILDKYANHPLCEKNDVLLPISSNQKMNAYLKELGDLCLISKKLTTHSGRHSFASLITLEEGVPIETISRMLGHSNIKTTQVYARVTPKKLFEDMDKLIEATKDLKLVL